MVDVDALWRDYAERLGIFSARPDFRKDADYVFRPAQNEIKPRDTFPTNRYQDMVHLRPALPQLLLQIMTPSDLKTAIEQEQPEAAQLAFELMLLGNGIDAELSDFSAAHYLMRYSEIAGAGIVPLVHYLTFGMNEGRDTLRKLRRNFTAGARAWDAAKPTILIVVEALGGADVPLVGLQLAIEASEANNVVVLALRTGPLREEFGQVSCGILISEHPRLEAQFAIGHLLERVEYAILASVETAPIIAALVERDIPFFAYIHEYAQYSLPSGNRAALASFAQFIAYSSESVRKSWQNVHLDIGLNVEQDTLVLSHAPLCGQVVLRADYLAARQRLSAVLGLDLAGRRVIYAEGGSSWRKGTDLFVMTAQMAHRRDPDAVFILIGDAPNPEDSQSGVWIADHLQDVAVNRPDGFFYAVADGPASADICMAADALMVASRLDPLPKAVVDAVNHDCDVVLFDNRTGFDDAPFAEMPRLHRIGFGLLDEAARILTGLDLKAGRCVDAPKGRIADTSSHALFPTLTEAFKAHGKAQRHFHLGLGQFDLPMLFSMRPSDAEYRLKERRLSWDLGRKVLWKSESHANRVLAASPYPVHQSSSVVRYSAASAKDAPEFSIHLHAFYTDELDYDVNRLSAYRHAKRVLVTTDTAAKANLIHAIGTNAGLKLEIELVPNQGRDILPFLRLFYAERGIAEGVWGHIHQKKCIGSSADGDIWRIFMQRLVLGDERRISSALTTMADSTVGLTAPFDPYIYGWNGARRLLSIIEPRIETPIPPHPLIFTVGNMFWTRAEVVRKMISFFGESFPYPNEPIANDGTVFHLIERLWPIASTECGLKSVFVCKPDQPRR
jgi:hypothetical protein